MHSLQCNTPGGEDGLTCNYPVLVNVPLASPSLLLLLLLLLCPARVFDRSPSPSPSMPPVKLWNDPASIHAHHRDCPVAGACLMQSHTSQCRRVDMRLRGLVLLQMQNMAARFALSELRLVCPAVPSTRLAHNPTKARQIASSHEFAAQTAQGLDGRGAGKGLMEHASDA